MDSATSVDDAALPRSRPMLTTLTELAEMFGSQVPTLSSCKSMRLHKSLTELFLLMCVLINLISSSSCASLEIQNYSLKAFNFSVTKNNVTTPKNLSDIIEFTPLNLPVELENITILNHENKENTSSKIITLKLKSHLIVENQRNNSQNGFHETNGEIKIMKPNASEDPLSEIEYLETEQNDNYDFLKWKLNSRRARMSTFDEETVVSTDSNTESNDSSEEDISKSIENSYESEDSQENQIVMKVHRSKYATGRQFVFHPYLPYGKDVPPDEKISFTDILPLKMVKFIKSMVEEAPWEQMFMKMVRMVVDQFVDKIIEKMFADKGDHHLKKRSLDILLTPTLILPSFHTPVVRLKRAFSINSSPEEDDDIFSYLPPKKMPQDSVEDGKKSDKERMSWLDQFLDFLFPNAKSEEFDEGMFDRLKKRDTTNTQLLKVLVAFFLNTFEKSSGFIADAKDVLRYKMLKEFLPYLYQKRFSNTDSDGLSNSIDAMKMTHRKFTKNTSKRNDIADNFESRSKRSKRSTRDHFQEKEQERLWQAHSQRHRPMSHRSRDECSLRKACNAGRLLSRLPSIQEITLQLRSNGNEPHWDALIWGMKKKRCSRIFCKRQRSPKGSKHSWTPEKERFLKKVEIITESPDVMLDEIDNLTI